MAFFDLLADEELTPEARQMLEEYRRLTGGETVAATWKVSEHPTALEKRQVGAVRLKLAGLHFVVGER